MERTVIEGIDLNDPERFKRLEHHEMFRRLRAEDPVYWQPDEFKGGGYWNVVKHADLIEVNRDSATFSSEVGGTMIMSGQFPIGEDPDMPFDTRGSLMLDMDPPKHTRYRLLVNKGFTPRMIGVLEQALQARASLIVDNVIEAGSADFVEDIAAELPLQAIAEIMGVPQEDRRRLFDWTNRMVGAGDPEYQDNDQQGAFVELFAYANDLAGKRKSDPRDDIVSKLLDAEIDGEQLSELEFDMFMLLLAVAGNETTRNATAHGMYAFLTNPEQFEILKRDPEARIGDASRRSSAGRRPYCTSVAPRWSTPRSAVVRSRPATASSSGTSRPTATKTCGTTRTRSTSHATRTPTWRSVAADRTSASAPTWRARSSG
jgi:cholest-4-en-3-one 26-monooxygenase